MVQDLLQMCCKAQTRQRAANRPAALVETGEACRRSRLDGWPRERTRPTGNKGEQTGRSCSAAHGRRDYT